MPIVIIDNASGGMVHWISDANTNLDALRELDKAIGIWPDGEPAEPLDGWLFYTVPKAAIPEIEAWIDAGQPAPSCPVCLT